MEHLGNFDYFLGLRILDGPLTNFATNFQEISIISSMREEIGGQLMKSEDYMEYSRYFWNPSQANSHKG